VGQIVRNKEGKISAKRIRERKRRRDKEMINKEE